MQLEFFDVPSPCIGVCQSDDKGQCKGCFRTRDERQTWITLDSDDKQKVIKRCKQRKKRKAIKESNVPVQIIEETISLENLQPSLLDPPVKSKLNIDHDLSFDDFEL